MNQPTRHKAVFEDYLFPLREYSLTGQTSQPGRYDVVIAYHIAHSRYEARVVGSDMVLAYSRNDLAALKVAAGHKFRRQVEEWHTEPAAYDPPVLPAA